MEADKLIKGDSTFPQSALVRLVTHSLNALGANWTPEWPFDYPSGMTLLGEAVSLWSLTAVIRDLLKCSNKESPRLNSSCL